MSRVRRLANRTGIPRSKIENKFGHQIGLLPKAAGKNNHGKNPVEILRSSYGPPLAWFRRVSLRRKVVEIV